MPPIQTSPVPGSGAAAGAAAGAPAKGDESGNVESSGSGRVYVDREYRRARDIPADTGAQWPRYVTWEEHRIVERLRCPRRRLRRSTAAAGASADRWAGVNFQRVCESESGEDLDWFFEPWAARFADGGEQRARTDRLAGVDTLHYHSKASEGSRDRA